MKKKLFLTFLAVSMLLLVLSVGATAIDKDTTATLSGSYKDESGNSVTSVKLYDSDGDALIWYINKSGALVSAKIASLVTVDDEGVISFSDRSAFKNSNDSGKSVVVINLRDNVKVSGTDINFDGKIFHFDSEKGMGDSTALVASGFQFGTYNYSSSVLEYFYFPTTAKSITKRMFQSTAVRVVDIEPGTPIEKMGMLAFYSAKNLKEILIPNDVQVLTSVQGQGVFEYCSSLTAVTFEEGSTLWDAGYTTFYGCTSLKSLKLPNSVKTFGSEFVRGCSNLEEFYFGSGFEYFTMRSATGDPDQNHMWVFYSCTKLKRVYMPATVKILSDEFNFDDLTAKDERLDTFDRIFSNAGSFTLLFTGTQEEMAVLKTRFNASEENQSLISAFNKIYSYSEYVELGITGSAAVYGYPLCEAFYDGAHIVSTDIIYESFDKAGVKVVGCTRQGCSTRDESAVPAFFEVMGVSVPEYANGAITVGYTVNYGAISEYEAYGRAVSYGVFAVSAAKLGDSEIFDENGNMASGVLSFDLTSANRAAFELKIVGFNTEEQMDAQLAMGVYVSVTDREETNYSYIQQGEPLEGEKYVFTSYNEAVSL